MSYATDFAFAPGQQVEIKVSGETGSVIAVMEPEGDDQYLVRYKAADGRATEQWWAEEALCVAEQTEAPKAETKEPEPSEIDSAIKKRAMAKQAGHVILEALLSEVPAPIRQQMHHDLDRQFSKHGWENE